MGELIRSTSFFFFKVNDELDKMGRIEFKFIIYITDVKRTLDEVWK